MSDNGQRRFPEAFDILDPPTDSTISFELLLDHFEREIIRIPDHQRTPDAWSREKKLRYIERLKEARDGCQPPGAFVTYQIEGGGPSWLNDGYQRLTALSDAKDDPGAFALEETGIQSILRQTVAKQHRHYRDHEHAMRDFQLINAGTHLSPYELCHGYLTYMPDWKNKWAPIVEEIHRSVEYVGVLVGKPSNGEMTLKQREMYHKHRRDDLALFLRFLTEDSRANYFVDIGKTKVDDLIDEKNVTELRLRTQFEKSGPAKTTEAVGKFNRHLKSEAALLDETRREVLHPGTALNPTLWRWLLHFSIWRRFSRTPVEMQKEFVAKTLKATGGSSQWLTADRERFTFALAHLGRLERAAELAEMPRLVEYARGSVRRKSVPGMRRPGFDVSHIDPFATHGDGETVPEPSSLNRARGAKPIEVQP